jgi:hypothetical protein
MAHSERPAVRTARVAYEEALTAMVAAREAHAQAVLAYTFCAIWPVEASEIEARAAVAEARHALYLAGQVYETAYTEEAPHAAE